ncbi:hypothetical protein ACFQS4_07435 [Saliphagus sp. GCM10025317]
MKRRTLLAALGTTTAFAGCLADSSRGADENRTPDETGSPNETDTTSETTGEDSDKAVDGTVLAHFDDGPTRPECERDAETIPVEYNSGETRAFETAATIPYPDAPTEFTEDDVVQFVDDFEHTYVNRSVLCRSSSRSNHVLGVQYDVRRRKTFDRDDDVTTVFLLRARGASSILHEDGSVSAAGIAYTGVVYAVDETGAARAEFDDAQRLEPYEYEANAPDPLETGELVVVFD